MEAFRQIPKGETPKVAGVRKLREETGIEVKEDDLIPIYTVCQNHSHGIYIGFATIIDNTKTRIVRQKGETVEHWFDYKIQRTFY